MTNVQEPNAWLLMAAGDNRQHGGNSGYDDQADLYYTWDSTVSNSRNVKVGDPIAIWDKQRLLGISVVEEIETSDKEKLIFRCPGAECGSSSIKARRSKSPVFRCQSCGLEFDDARTEVTSVREYRSRHDAGWTSLDNLLTGDQLRGLCDSPKSQLSMRSLNWAAFRGALDSLGAENAVSRVLGRTPGILSNQPAGGQPQFSSGHALAVVRVRRGQRTFRDRLLKTYSGQCAFTGSAPDRVLEAGHLYSYAKLGEHLEHGGLLLRRDVHRLFDDGWLAVEPSTLRVDVSASLEAFPQYAQLQDKPLQVDLHGTQIEWLDKHWKEHRP
jgi:predicted RNA-binding Zn-ribbon protein involved in translation (DUF1610 family)